MNSYRLYSTAWFEDREIRTSNEKSTCGTPAGLISRFSHRQRSEINKNSFPFNQIYIFNQNIVEDLCKGPFLVCASRAIPDLCTRSILSWCNYIQTSVSTQTHNVAWRRNAPLLCAWSITIPNLSSGSVRCWTASAFKTFSKSPNGVIVAVYGPGLCRISIANYYLYWRSIGTARTSHIETKSTNCTNNSIVGWSAASGVSSDIIDYHSLWKDWCMIGVAVA